MPWQRRLQWAPLIDNLLADASWVRIWRALRDAAGDMALVAEMLHVDSSSLRGFKDRATEAAIQFNEKFHDIPHPGRTRNKKGILAAFAAEHRHFLTAPDLSTVMSPGTRRRSVTAPIARPRPSRQREVVLTLCRLEVLDRVTQRGTWHHRRIADQENAVARHGRPACRLRAATSRRPCESGRGDRQQDHGQPIEIFCLAPTEEVLAADHGNPAVPEPLDSTSS